jgi:hypothetical protein
MPAPKETFAQLTFEKHLAGLIIAPGLEGVTVGFE